MDYYNYGVPNQAAINPWWFGINPSPQMNNQTAMPQQTPMQPQSDLSFTWVRGREFARNCPMAPNTSKYFMDEQEPYLYKKTVDANGRTSEFIVTKLTVEEEKRPEIQQTSPSNQNFVTKDDFNMAITELKNMISGMNKQTFNKPYNKGGNRNA